ncbi:hemerythrin domain-containing protein [Curvibacter sp. HBC28]|uniref:Hemerythrin domain-containing protein n=1 Tax=Curvibacter microcysteis TaxID=3026419 RepID=A0ABT5MKD6_9BURK|nr:hemerythrin domain-containing protein [Curvibacter sp. HBC28]MDD0817047.1 hemerythrin domain-containing protein [Curvibacter sp. HBC28]
MVSPLVLHAPPAVGFESPFEMLDACHERVERTLALLERLSAHLQTQGEPGPAQSAARDVLRYFDLAAPLHHEDEEQHVFPPLLTGADPVLAALAQALIDEHRLLAQAWTRVRQDLQACLAPPPLPAFSAAQAQGWADFCALYRQHLRREDQVAYPAAQAVLDRPARQHMGREMAARRGQRPPEA